MNSIIHFRELNITDADRIIQKYSMSFQDGIVQNCSIWLLTSLKKTSLGDGFKGKIEKQIWLPFSVFIMHLEVTIMKWPCKMCVAFGQILGMHVQQNGNS